MKVQNKARFKLISICSKHTSADNQHLKRSDKQNKRCCMYTGGPDVVCVTE